MLRRRPFFLLLAAGLLSCVDLPTIVEGSCGNGFIEPGEDCDVFDPRTPTDGAACYEPGTPNQCRYQCTGPAECQSALGSSARCGVDKVCRQPKGDDGHKGTFFTPASSLIPDNADDLFSGDFDGDGRKDVLAVGQAGFDIHYFTAEGSVAKSLHVPGAPVAPAIGDLTNTPADAFTLDVGQGIGVMLGRAGQTIEPRSYLSLNVKKRYQTDSDSGAPDNMRLLLVDTGATMSMMGPRIGPSPLALSSSSDVVTLIDAAVDPKMGKVILGSFSGLGSKELLGTIPVAFPKVGADRQLFVLALQDEPAVYVMDAGAMNPANIKSQIDLPLGFTVHGASFFTDVNGDGFTDVLVGAADCSKVTKLCKSAEIEVAYGSGDGSFYALEKTGPTWDPAQLGKMAKYRNVYPDGDPPPSPTLPLNFTDIALYLPLGVGRFNLDLDVDYVNAFGIYISNSGNQLSCVNAPNGYCQVDRSSGGQLWSEVKIGDFNGNDRLDVAAVTRGTKGINFFSGTGLGIFNTFSIPTEGVPSNLGVGDFDGDFLLDLTFDSVTSKMGADVHTLFVAFGQPTGAPDLPVSMGEVANLRQIVPGNLSSFSNDAASDIVLLSGIPASVEGGKKTDGKDWNVGLSQGNGYRQLQAPLIFFAPKSINVDATPLASAIGLFDADVKHADVAAIVQSFRTKGPMNMGGHPPFCELQASLWVLPAEGDAAIAPPADDSRSITITTSNPGVSDNFLPIRELVEAVPLRLDGETTDRLLIAFPTYANECNADLNQIGAFGELLLANFNAGDKDAPPKIEVIKSSGKNTFFLRLHVGYIDGDKNLDIAALETEFDFKKSTISTRIVVLRGNGNGAFEDPVDINAGGFPVDFALVDTDGDSAMEIVVASEAKEVGDVAQLSVIAWNKATEKFDTLLPRVTVVDGVSKTSDPLGLDQPTALVGGDFDGDGVDDVAAAVAGGIQIFKGIAK